MSSCSKEKEVLLNIIEVYKNLPHLWQKEHEDYKNKELREEGFDVLLRIYNNFDEKATMKMLKKKIENMRTCYSKELKKVLASRYTAAGRPGRPGRLGRDDLYVPSLWYFDAFSFLETTTECNRSVTDSAQYLNSSSDEETAGEANCSSTRQKRTRKNIQSVIKENMILLTDKNKIQKPDEWETYGRSIGFQMRDMNQRQLMISQKIISDVLFYAKLDQLSESSHVVLTPPPPPPPRGDSVSDSYGINLNEV